MNRLSFTLLLSLLLAACGSDSTEGGMVGQLAWDRVELTNESAEPITAILHKEGDRVQAGETLVQLDTRRAQAQLAQAQAEHRRAAAALAEIERGTREEQLAQARATLAGAEATLVQAGRDLSRQRRLAKQKLTSPEDVDKAATAREQARAERDAAAERLAELENGATAEERRQAEETLAAAAAAEQEAGVALERLSIRAPQSGRLDSLPFETGERPSVGSVVAVLLTGDAPYARLYVPEPLRSRIAVGDSLDIHVDGRERTYRARVRRIDSDPAFTPFYSLSENDRSHLAYLAEAVLEDATNLPAGVPVQASLPADAGR